MDKSKNTIAWRSITRVISAFANRFKKRAFTTDEMLALLDALIEANATSDADVRAHFDLVHKKYGRVDRIPYDDAMKLIDLVRASNRVG